MDFCLPEQADAVVCGAGPAGLVTALRLASSGQSVVLLDRRDPWREPVSCAEAVSVAGLNKWLGVIDPAWIRGQIDGVVFVAPNGIQIEYQQKESGLILDRVCLHKGLADKAYAAGAKLHFRANVQSIMRDHNCDHHVREGQDWLVQGVLHGEKPFTIRTKCVVDASGAGGKLTRHLPELAHLEDGSFDLEPAVFALIEGIEHKSDMIEMDFSQVRFPGGYGWVFPRDGHTVNVGLVIAKEFTSRTPARKLLQAWIDDRWPNAKVSSFYGGAIPCGQSNKALAAHGVFKVGDAASQVNPISRSGIVEGIKGGVVTAKAVQEWLKASSPEQRKAIEANLLADWFEVQGKSHQRLSRAKAAFASIPDDVFNKAATRIQNIPVAKRTLPRIFLKTLIGSPMLLWRMRSLMGL